MALDVLLKGEGYAITLSIQQCRSGYVIGTHGMGARSGFTNVRFFFSSSSYFFLFHSASFYVSRTASICMRGGIDIYR
jgi:hypothetical protein